MMKEGQLIITSHMTEHEDQHAVTHTHTHTHTHYFHSIQEICNEEEFQDNGWKSLRTV